MFVCKGTFTGSTPNEFLSEWLTKVIDKAYFMLLDGVQTPVSMEVEFLFPAGKEQRELLERI